MTEANCFCCVVRGLFADIIPCFAFALLHFGWLSKNGGHFKIGMAPVVYSGTSLWQFDQTHFISNDNYSPAKPLASKREDQLQLLDFRFWESLEWNRLAGIGQTCYSILASSTLITAERANTISKNFEGRIIELIQRLQHTLAPGLEP